MEGRQIEGQENFYVAVAEVKVPNYSFACVNLNLNISSWQFSFSKCQIICVILKHVSKRIILDDDVQN